MIKWFIKNWYCNHSPDGVHVCTRWFLHTARQASWHSDGRVIW